MPTIKSLIFALVLALTSLLLTADAQTLTISTVNLSAEHDNVQIAAQGDIVELRLEVINPAGEIVFDSGSVSAPTLEWSLRDSQGARVPEGVYICAISYRNSAGKLRKRIEQVTVTAAPQSVEAGASVSLAPQPSTKDIPQSATITLMGGGTAGQLAKWTSSSSLGNSVIGESNGKVGVGTTAPTAALHVTDTQPTASATNGTAAPTLLQTSGGKGGNTTGTTGQVAGAGASISLLAGSGGDAPAGSNRGNGGSITLQPGGPGGGLGTGGVTGNLLLAPTGGNVGVGTTTPASKLTVAGVIQSTTGGLKFPDNTVQTTASKGGTITGVSAGTGLTGGGTTGTVTLGLASGGVGNAQLAANAVTAPKIASGQVVKSLNSLTDNVTLAAGSSNITITKSGNTLTLDAPNAAFTGVTHDSTLAGSGTSNSPLGVASGNFIQNAKAAQTANFNITGSGVVGGNLGIGTTAPTSKVEIAAQDGLKISGYQPFLTLNDTNSALRSYLQGANGGLVFVPDSFHQANSAAMVIQNGTGNVGIGTSTPSSKVEIAAQDGLKISGYQPFLTLNDLNAFGQSAFLQGVNGDAVLLTNSRAALVLKDVSGNVGIGNPAPPHRLSVSGGPTWTSNGWTGTVALDNISAIGWQADAEGWHFGIGQTDGGLYFFRTTSDLGSSATPASYSMVLDDGGNMTINGNVAQPRSMNGFPKAMLYVNGDGTMGRCYNGVAGSNSGNCFNDFQITRQNTGQYLINFPFDVFDRFVSATGDHGYTASVYSGFGSNGIIVYIYSDGSNQADAPFFLIIY